MNAYLLIFLSLLALVFFGSGVVWAGWLIVFLVLLDVIGGFLIRVFKFGGAVVSGISETGGNEFENVAAAKTKYPSGMKFAEDTLKITGKEIGKGEKAKHQHKKTEKWLAIPDVVSFSGNILQGIGKVLKK